VDIEGEVESHEVGVLDRPEHGEPRAESGLDDRVDGLGVADPGIDEVERLAPEGVLQPVADEARNVALDVDGRLADAPQERERALDGVGPGVVALDDLDERDEVLGHHVLPVVHRLRQRVMSSPRRSSVFSGRLRSEPVQFRAVSSS
jgi:hypothetical protein